MWLHVLEGWSGDWGYHGGDEFLHVSQGWEGFGWRGGGGGSSGWMHDKPRLSPENTCIGSLTP